jgi:para-aminobenzoate synthetase component 1
MQTGNGYGLNNDDKPVIGLLPKVSWSVFNNTDTCYNSSTASHSHTSDRQASVYKIIKTYRDDSNAVTIAYTSYIEWQDELIAYSKAYEDSAIALHTKTAKPSYHQGLIGFVGYDMSAHELSPAANIELARQPCAFLGHYDTYLTPIDNEGQIHWSLMVTTSQLSASS